MDKGTAKNFEMIDKVKEKEREDMLLLYVLIWIIDWYFYYNI